MRSRVIESSDSDTSDESPKASVQPGKSVLNFAITEPSSKPTTERLSNLDSDSRSEDDGAILVL